MDLFRYRCYLASLQGGELPNPKRLLAFASRPTKVAMGRLGIFSVSSFHALVSLNRGQGSSLPTCRSFHVSSAETTSTNSSLCAWGVSLYLRVQNILLPERAVCPRYRLKSRRLQAMALRKWKNHVSLEQVILNFQICTINVLFINRSSCYKSRLISNVRVHGRDPKVQWSQWGSFRGPQHVLA